MRALLFVLLILVLPINASAETYQISRLITPQELLPHQNRITTPKVSIILDDVGYQLDKGKQIIALPAEITIAIIPFTPYGRQIAELAQQNGKEIMLHTPMETLSTHTWEQGLESSMQHAEFEQATLKMLADIPYVRGVNNHGGSRLTQDHERMTWLMSILQKEQLYFIDSRTTPKTVAKEAAAIVNITHSSRDVFLDNTREVRTIEEQIQKLSKIAFRKGHAIGIGHPYPETILALKRTLPILRQSGIEVVSVSKLLNSTIYDQSIALQQK